MDTPSGSDERGRSSAGRASRSQCEGQGFDPPRLHQTPAKNFVDGKVLRESAARLLVAEVGWQGLSGTPKFSSDRHIRVHAPGEPNLAQGDAGWSGGRMDEASVDWRNGCPDHSGHRPGFGAGSAARGGRAMDGRSLLGGLPVLWFPRTDPERRISGGTDKPLATRTA